MRRPTLALAALALLAACGQGAPDTPATVLLETSRVDSSAEGRARDLCRAAAQADGFDVLGVSDVRAVDGGIEMLLSLSDRGAFSSQRCIVSGSTAILGAA
jgi:hypothetical protein